MIKPVRIAANCPQVTLTWVFRWQLFEVSNLEFRRPTRDATHLFQALQSFQ
jgi:hypothetical protein